MKNLQIDIWKDIEYISIDGFRPLLTAYIINGLDNKPPKGAVLICPGGGYGYTSPREAEPIALQFINAGFHAFIINYSVAPYKHPQPIYDVARSMCIIRENAKEWNIDPNNIALCGFSAGGHLAASLGVHHQNSLFKHISGITFGRHQPNKLILSYPVITSVEFSHEGSISNLLGNAPSSAELDFMSLDKQVTKMTPPTFLWHTYEDDAVPVENSLLFANALRRNLVPFELNIFPYGGHGLSLATPETSDNENQLNPHVAHWMPLCIEWLKLT